MNKRFFYSVIAVMTVFFTACSPPHYCPEIRDWNIAEVRITTHTSRPSEGIWRISKMLGTVNYENGILDLSFLDSLPIIPDEYLGEWFWLNSSNIIPEGVTISDPQARITNLDITAFNAVEQIIGHFSLRNNPADFRDTSWMARFVYADRDFRITGRARRDLEYDVSLVKGWNIVYHRFGLITTQKPENEIFEWRYEQMLCM